MTSSFLQLRALLTELFQLDQADLDFGVYRIMNQRRDEILTFLDDQLLPQVQTELAAFGGSEQQSLQAELAKAEQTVRDMGLNPDDAPRVKELRAKLSGGHSAQDAEDEIFSRLTDFFRRYYDQGDFLALPRYKEGVYAIPYNGEEVKLHWANADQYYIKSSEALRDYSFVVGGRRVHFRLSDAEMSRDNNKPDDAKKRVFGLTEDSPVGIEDGDIIVRFAFRADPTGRRQEALNTLAAETVLASSMVDADVRAALASPDPKASAKKSRTVLDGHLRSYTARNTFDYFIHKDLGAFLRRELDFYVKNEVLFLDDLDTQTSAARIEQTLLKVRVLRRLAHKLIDFLAQLEDFQKSLWLKKKFVVETSWGVTLDRVPAALYAEVAASDAQRAAWVEKFAIDAIAADTVTPGYSVPLSEDFLRAHPFLVLDTRHFSAEFTDRLLASFDDLDAATDGLLVNGENFQALSLLQARYKEQVKCIYIDPPYNTGGDGFAYKDNYQHSSWLSMMADRLAEARRLLPDDGALFVSIDDDEQANLKRLLDEVFGAENFVASIIWQKKYAPQNDAKWFSDDHDFVVNYAKDKATWRPTKLARTEEQDKLYKNPDNDPRGVWASDNYLSNKSADQRPNLYYAIVHPATNEEIWPPKNAVWRYNCEQHKKNVADNRVWWGKDGTNSVPRFKRFLTEVGDVVPRTIWPYTDVGHNQDAVRELRDMMPQSAFASPKPTRLIRRVLEINPGDVTMDFFAGSGTTGHAVINLNRTDGGRRKYVLVEMGDYFENVTRPRIEKAIHSADWKDGKPVGRAGVSHLFQCLRLESYDDTLNNLERRRTETQQAALDAAPSSVREDYLLRYSLATETRGSASLVNADAFAAPEKYLLEVGTEESAGATKATAVDLETTFTLLLGLRVRTRRVVDGMTVVAGDAPDGARVLVLWRTLAEMPNDKLNDWWTTHGKTLTDKAIARIYVNGDCTLPSRRADGELWTVERTEAAFARLMFDTTGLPQ